MKIPALKARIGDWDYYVTTLSFEQVNQFVSRIDDQLHKSDSLKDLIQRSITSNYLSIKEYILHQPELFFNSLVLAVYDDYPDWREIEFKYDGVESYQMGLLDFPSTHKIFPVDGQHRVEGIKAALLVNPGLKDQRISAVFIGHKNDDNGKQRTRRVFSTLNRYAKPVSLDDIIALDEDDSVAILTRHLLEDFDLFTEKRVVVAKQKGIPSTNKDALTSIITLYQANFELFKYFYQTKFPTRKASGKVLTEFLKFRPSNELLNEYIQFSIDYWNSFKTKLSFIALYLTKTANYAEQFRNSDSGGNLVFRPIGFLPLIKASIWIQKTEEKPFDEIFERFDHVNFALDTKPWEFVLWNPIQGRMVMGSDAVTELLLIYLYNPELLDEGLLQKLREGYASKISYDNADLNQVLDNIIIPD